MKKALTIIVNCMADSPFSLYQTMSPGRVVAILAEEELPSNRPSLLLFCFATTAKTAAAATPAPTTAEATKIAPALLRALVFVIPVDGVRSVAAPLLEGMFIPWNSKFVAPLPLLLAFFELEVEAPG